MPVHLASFVPLNAINMATEFKTCNTLAPRAYSATLGYNPRHILRSSFRQFFFLGVIGGTKMGIQGAIFLRRVPWGTSMFDCRRGIAYAPVL